MRHDDALREVTTMTFQTVLAQATVGDLAAAERWYAALFGRGPDATPMDGLLEWHLGDGSGVQVWAEPERAGRSSIVLGESALAGLAARLTGAGIDHPGPQQATSSRILPLQDPDGNRVTVTGT